MRTSLILSALLMLFMSSCVSKKRYTAIKTSNDNLANRVEELRRDLEGCRTDLSAQRASNEHLREQNKELNVTNAALLNNVGNMAILSAKEAENLERSLESIREKDLHIRSLQDALTKKDSVTLALVVSLKGSLGNLNDEDVEINVEKGVVFISISDKMLFKSGSTQISDRANEVLAKVAKVVQDKPEMEFLVEGHTDNVPISKDCIKDNWDLSVLRATSIVRELTNKHGVDPARITAGGRGEHVPLASNDTPENKATNRRTRIVVLPKLDQFYEMIETGLKDMEHTELPTIGGEAPGQGDR
jgi:chemotaxis protein MotB